MKKFVGSLLLVVGIVLLSIMLDSCQKDELEPGIVYTNNPPESLFINGYANTNRLWVDNITTAKKIKNENVCDQRYNNFTGGTEYFDCGIWRLILARKYWGIQNGIIYVSESVDWYIISPQRYLDLSEEVSKRQTVTVYFWAQQQNPFGMVNPSITGIEY